MGLDRRRHVRVRSTWFTLLVGGILLTLPESASASSVLQVSWDTYSNTSSLHATEVEPDTFAFGSTHISTFQVGRFFDGGSSNVGWASSSYGGQTWHHGVLPGTTVYQGGPYARLSDPSVAYDARVNRWLIATLGLTGSPSVRGSAVLVSRSADAVTWTPPYTVASTASQSLDKPWVACDNTATSPFYGNCYAEWDDNADGNRIKMSTSTDSGRTWGPVRQTANNAAGLGGQPLVQPNGVVVVPIANANETAIGAFVSTDGGASWTSPVTIAGVVDHTVAGGLRTSPLPTAEIDGAGRLYVAWQDCRFRTGCNSNDIVMSSSTNGTSWSSVVRIPIDVTSSSDDHFIPGLGVDRSTSGTSAHLALTYYYYPNSNCSASTCQLYAGYVSSSNGGSTWSAPTQVAGPMTLSWLPQTNQGTMVGDYISTSIIGTRAWPLVEIARAPSGGVLNQGSYVVTGGLPVGGGTARVASGPVVAGASESSGVKSRRGRGPRKIR